MNVKPLDKSIAIIYQTFTDDDIELQGEPALIIQEWVGSGTIEIGQDDGSVLINYDSIDPLIKVLRAIMNDKDLRYDVKL